MVLLQAVCVQIKRSTFENNGVPTEVQWRNGGGACINHRHKPTLCIAGFISPVIWGEKLQGDNVLLH